MQQMTYEELRQASQNAATLKTEIARVDYSPDVQKLTEQDPAVQAVDVVVQADYAQQRVDLVIGETVVYLTPAGARDLAFVLRQATDRVEGGGKRRRSRRGK